MDRIILEVNNADEMRYKTVGDWYDTSDGHGFISTVDTGNEDYNFCLLMHELTEYILCKRAGISAKTVDDWDLAHEDADDPGAIQGCPYFEQHMMATIVEDVFLSLFKGNPYEYDKVVEMAWYVVERALNKKQARKEVADNG